MRQLFKNIFLFTAFAAGCYLLLIFFMGGEYVPQILKPNLNYKIGSYGYSYLRFKEVKTFKNANILFLGASHAYRGFDTRYFENRGVSSFNLGSSAQTPIQTNVLLKRYLNILNPDLIVYEVYPATFASDGVESSLDLVANDKNDIYSLEMALKVNSIKTFNSLTYAWIRDVLHLNAGFTEPQGKDGDTYVKGGYVEKKMRYWVHDHPKPVDLKFIAKQFRNFESNLELIKERGIKTFFVNTPIPPASNSSIMNNHEFDSIMKTYGDYYNFNTTLALDDSLYFYDSNHLNQAGVEIFNEKLFSLLVDKKLIKNSR